MEKIKSSFYWIAVLFVIFSVLAVGSGLIGFFYNKPATLHASLGQVGDFFGGIFGAFISMFAFFATIIASIFIYQTLITQQEQLRLQRETEVYNRISGIYLKKLDSLNSQIQNIRNGDSVGWDAISSYFFHDSNRTVFERIFLDFEIRYFHDNPYFDLTRNLRQDLSQSFEWFDNITRGGNPPLNQSLQIHFDNFIFFQINLQECNFLFFTTNQIITDRISLLDVDDETQMREIESLRRTHMVQEAAIQRIRTIRVNIQTS